jgi:hypothetical protein
MKESVEVKQLGIVIASTWCPRSRRETRWMKIDSAKGTSITKYISGMHC